MKRLIVSSLLSLSLLSVSAQAADLPEADFQKAMDTYLKKEENVNKVGEVLVTFLKKKQEDQQKAQQEEEAKQFEEQFKNPAKVDIGKSPVRGPENAKYTIVEFSDFQCPYCKRGADVMDELAKKHPNDVRVAFKHFPLPFHPEAKGASKAAIAAGNQGKFWEMHDKLFGDQAELSEASYLKYAEELKLDMGKFKIDMASEATAKQLDDDMKLGQSLGVQGTPGFFINGIQVRGARPAPFFEQIMQRLSAQK